MRKGTVRDKFRVAVVLLATALVLPVSVLASAPARSGYPVLVIAPPWSGGAVEVVRRSGGREVSPIRTLFTTIAVLDDPADARKAGAWAVLDATAFAAFCTIDDPREPETG